MARAFPIRRFHVPLYRPAARSRRQRTQAQAPMAFPTRARRSGALNEQQRDRALSTTARAIEDGALDGQKLEICWLKDPFEALLDLRSRARRA
mgnify:CR=1 FL=1